MCGVFGGEDVGMDTGEGGLNDARGAMQYTHTTTVVCAMQRGRYAMGALCTAHTRVVGC